MSSLYELVMDFKELSEIDFDAVDQEKIEEIKEIIKAEIENKGTNIIALIRNIESDVKAINDEINRLAMLKIAKNNKIDNLKKYTKMCLSELGMKKVETTLGNITIRNNAPSLVIEDERLVNEKFKVETTTVKVDKKAIKEAIANGENVLGVRLESSNSLLIK